MPKVTTKRSKAGWTTVAFGDVVRQVKDKVDPEESGLEHYVAGEHMDTDDLRIRRRGKIGNGYLGPAFHMRFKSGQVLYGSRRTYLRKVAVPDFDGITANTTYVLESADPRALLHELLPFVLQSWPFINHAIRESKGSVNPYINYPDLEWYEFDLPSQLKQVELLRALRAAEATYQTLRELQSRLGAAIAAMLDSVFDPYATRELMKRRTGELPADWTTVGSVAPLQVGFAFKSSGFSSSGDRLLRGSNVAVDATLWEVEDTRYWPTELRGNHYDFVLNEDDIVIAMDRPFITAGFKVARLTRDDLPALLLQRVGRFMTDEQHHRDLIWAYLHSRAFQYQLLSQQEGTDLPHVSKAQIEGAFVHKVAIKRVDDINRFCTAWRESVNLKRRIEHAAEAKRQLIEAALL